MNKKGVSPVIATVLLIVIVIVLATIIFIWAKSFLTESATKGDRVVEASCEDVVFEAQIAINAPECIITGQTSALDINNIGNIPIYGVKVLKYDKSTGNIDPLTLNDQTFIGGTVKIGQSSYVCIDSVRTGDTFRVIPKLLAEKEKTKITYTCPEKDGITVTVV